MAFTGIGLPATESTGGGTPGQNIIGTLSNNQIPRYNATTRQFEGSGFSIDPLTGAIRGAGDIETDGSVQAGDLIYLLGLAHAVRSSAENVTFQNLVTGLTFHPTWQTTDSRGNWATVQRTPIGDLVENAVFQADRSQTVTNPNFEFTSLAFTHRLYSINVEPIANATGVVVLIERRNAAGTFVNYWRSGSVDLTASPLTTPAPQTVAITPFIDLMGSTVYRLRTVSAGDVQLRGNAAGVPRITLTYRQWEDRPLATRADATLTGAQILALLNAMSGISIQTTDQSEITNTLTALTANTFPIGAARGVTDSRYRLINQDIFLPGRPVFESAGPDLGEILRLSESAGALSVINTIDNIHRTLLGFRAPTNAPSFRPRRLALTQAERQLDIQANVSESLTGNAISQNYTIPQRGRINAIRLQSNSAVFGLRMQITSGFDDVKYIPSREAWLNNTGLDFSPGGELDIRLDDSPLFSDTNQVLTVAFRKNSGTLLGTTAGGPAFVIRIQNGDYVESADLADIVDTFTGLTDTPATLTPHQFFRVNAAGTALESVRDPSRWDHRDAPTTGTLSADHHVWWRNTANGDRTLTLPTLGAGDEGWDVLWENYTTTGQIFLNGPFGGTVNQLLLTASERAIVGWNGTVFTLGPR